MRLLLCLLLFTSAACQAQPEPAPASVSGSSEPDSLGIKIGQMMLVGFRGMTLEPGTAIYEDLTERHIGNVILFDYDVTSKRPVRNVESPEQVAALVEQLQAAAGDTPLLIAIDQEGGRVNRLKERNGFRPTVSAQTLGERGVEATREEARATAEQLAELGINLNFAPVVDVNVNPTNPVIGGIERSFSADPEAVAAHAQAVIEAHHEAGVFSALKHFPGHGSSTEDSHLGLTDVTRTWTEAELVPYRRLVSEGIVDMVMTAHIVHRELEPSGRPATLSPAIMTGILRDSLRFEGVIVSDDMQMGAIRDEYGLEDAIRMALEAGVDILTFGNNVAYEPELAERAIAIIRGLVEAGTLTEDRIDASYRRVMRLKSTLKRGEGER
ncbi:MAG: glycoside hydrolase family 3 protein [Bacteroidota bacterium]